MNTLLYNTYYVFKIKNYILLESRNKNNNLFDLLNKYSLIIKNKQNCILIEYNDINLKLLKDIINQYNYKIFKYKNLELYSKNYNKKLNCIYKVIIHGKYKYLHSNTENNDLLDSFKNLKINQD